MMFDYDSPIKIIQKALETKMENDIFTAVQHYDIDVDKEELIKALRYDRDQYEKGRAAAIDECVEAFKEIAIKWFANGRMDLGDITILAEQLNEK